MYPKFVKVISQPHSKLLFSANINDKRSIFTFLNYDSCHNCINYLNKYRNRYNEMPNFEPGIYSYKYKNELTEPLISSNKNLLELQYKCFTNHIGLIGITKFNYSSKNNIIITKFNAYNLFNDTEYFYEKHENDNITDNILSLNNLVFE